LLKNYLQAHGFAGALADGNFRRENETL